MSDLRYTFSAESSGRPYHKPNITDELCVNCNCCVVMDGTEVLYVGESERFTKVKNDASCPVQALEAFKTHFDAEAYCDRPFSDDNIPLRAVRLHSNDGSRMAIVEEVPQTKTSGGPSDNQAHDGTFYHIYSAFYLSGFKDACVMVCAGSSPDGFCIILAHAEEGKQPRILKTFPSVASPCCVYEEAAMQVFGEAFAEGKLMGLAAYGNDCGETFIAWDDETKQIICDAGYGKKKIHDYLSKINFDGTDVMQAKDLAFTIQKNYEDTMVEVVKHFKFLLDEEGTVCENLCLSGGGVNNALANTEIVELGAFNNFYASPQPADAFATAVGRSLCSLEKDGTALKSKRLSSSCLGVEYSISDLTCNRERLSSPFEALIDHIRSGGIVAWYQGGSEFGPKGAGHRAFLADPTSMEATKAMNRVKGRATWRPLALVVPEELFLRIFDVDNVDMFEFCHRTAVLKERWKSRLKPVVSADGTCMPHLLKRDVNPLYYDFLMAHFEITHIPCLAASSLNVNGFPIVETPRDLCNLQEEICHMENLPDLLTVFVEGDNFYEVIPNEAWLRNVT